MMPKNNEFSDRKQQDEERRLQDANWQAFEQQRLLDRQLTQRAQAEEWREWADEKCQYDAHLNN